MEEGQVEEGDTKFAIRVNKLCTACKVYCVILRQEHQPQFFHGDPFKHCTRTWLMIEQSVLSYLGNATDHHPKGNPDDFCKRAAGAVQLKKYTELHDMLREYCALHAPCYIVLQNITDREYKNEVLKAGAWERLPLAQAIEMALAYVPSAEQSGRKKKSKSKEVRPASIKCEDQGQVVAIYAPKRLRKLIQEQWPRHFTEGKSIYKFRLEDYPGASLDTVVKRVRRWEEMIKEGKEIKIITL
jgi:hypothetical protein